MERSSWEWVGGKGVTTVAEWDLICGDHYKKGLAQTVFFIGLLFGKHFPCNLVYGFWMGSGFGTQILRFGTQSPFRSAVSDASSELMICYNTKRTSDELGKERGHWEESIHTICVWIRKCEFTPISGGDLSTIGRDASVSKFHKVTCKLIYFCFFHLFKVYSTHFATVIGGLYQVFNLSRSFLKLNRPIPKHYSADELYLCPHYIREKASGCQNTSTSDWNWIWIRAAEHSWSAE